MGFRSSSSLSLMQLAVLVVVVLLLCTAVECSRPLRDHVGGGGGFSVGRLPVFAVARAGPSPRGPGH
ncbi:Os02g0188400 [Oryza sativa Japonica Group]|uniref:Os02g0188400 protein n=4 Tax=Oryza TaxID=4527 RepID=Q6ZHR9_ORYSJ|nr:hypothetical protein DAI22_02g069200 [Oryza sativa Japonica Group]BAD15524.1 unknown protein [Oryza sativa Japonica Group]BAF08048.1 Os02g0188400 [Oryza sativa Japonica Group]|eukprot:NP_001046134.1 Os02g0188400 [Oryza sativa Japonica Group]